METFWAIWSMPDAKGILGTAVAIGFLFGILFMRIMR